MTTPTGNRFALLLFVYRSIVIPVAMLLLPFAGVINRKMGEGLRLRRKIRPDKTFEERPLWIHAASGEFEYAKAVIRDFKAARPEVPILVTYFSPTYVRNVETFPGVDLAVPLPLDLPGPVSSFLKRYHPRALLISRTDFWPELLTQTRKLGIPISVFAYTQKSPDGMNRITRKLAQWRLSMVDRIFCVSPEDVRNIEKLLPGTDAEPFGDTRYDQVQYRLSHPKSLPEVMKPSLNGRNGHRIPVLIAGSTWREDEDVLLSALTGLLLDRKLKLILVPHEPTPEHLTQLRAKLSANKLDFVLFSSPRKWSDEPILLVDQTGWLAELYQWAQIAFIGGSFRKSVHSVMEALGAGCLTLVGPKHTNNREAIEFQDVSVGPTTAVLSVANREEMKSAVERLCKADFEKFKPELNRVFAQYLGASSKLAAHLAKTI